MGLEAASRSDISPFFVMEVMRAAAAREAAGDQVLHLEVGQPSSPAPLAAREAAKRAIDSETLGYTGALGIDPLRDRIARHYADWYGVDVERERIVVTTGASGAFVLAFLACFDVGDRVAVMSPGYPAYRNTLQSFGIEVVDVPVGPETRFQPAPQLLAEAGPLDGVIAASPSNPTGTMLLPDELEALTRWCETNEVRFISDEIYHGITYEVSAPTAAALWDEVIVINSFSKYFSMTGWRLGWMVVPDSLSGPVERLAQNATIAPPTVSQHAAMGAFAATEELEANVARYRENRAVLLGGLPEVGLARLAPADGGFYIYADVSDFTDDSQALCAHWLEEYGVATTPGIDFDPTNGNRYVRLSFAGATEHMHATVERLSSWAARRG